MYTWKETAFWTGYSHKGLFFGFIPVYINPEESTIMGRNKFCDWLVTAFMPVAGAMIWLKSFLNPEWEPVFPVRVTGEFRMRVWK